MVRKAIYPLIFLLSLLMVVAAGPSKSRITSSSVTLSASATDTITLTTFVNTGDSIGLMLEVNLDSISGYLFADPVTDNGYSGVASMDDYDTVMTIVNNLKGTFSTSISRVAGSYNSYLYLILTNNKATAQTVTYSLYKVIWQ